MFYHVLCNSSPLNLNILQFHAKIGLLHPEKEVFLHPMFFVGVWELVRAVRWNVSGSGDVALTLVVAPVLGAAITSAAGLPTLSLPMAAVTLHVKRKLLINKNYFSTLALRCEGCLQRRDTVQFIITQYQDNRGVPDLASLKANRYALGSD